MKNKTTNIVFYLMNTKGLTVLQNVLKTDRNIIKYVVTAPDNNVVADSYQEIIDLCNRNRIKHFVRGSKIPVFKGYKIAIGWRWLINDFSNLVILHDSLLPKYRGFAPLVNSLINGESFIGVSAISAMGNYDTGDIIFQERKAIKYPIKIKDAIDIVAGIYADLVIRIIELLKTNSELPVLKQNEKEATYSLWLDELDYYIQWENSSDEIKRKIDAVGFPYNGAKTYLNNKLITIEDAKIVTDVHIENRTPGKIIFIEENFPIVVCGSGLLKLIRAHYSDSGLSIFPLKKFRTRLGRLL